MYLDKLNWLPFNRERLEIMIDENANQGNYAVFDWDFTCVFNDTQDNFFIYQIENLLFKLNPKEFSKAIRHNIPQDSPMGIKNDADIELTASLLSADLDKLYELLYSIFIGLAGNYSLSEVKKTPEFNDFRVKLFLLMRGGQNVSQTDIAQIMSTGFTLAEYEKIAETMIDSALCSKLEAQTFTSANIGSAGQCTIRWKKGIRVQPEIQNLIKVLHEHKIDTYICTASQRDNINVFATLPKYGYNVKSENVFGRRRVFDNEGKFSVKDDLSLGFTRGSGKANTIKNFIMKKHGGKAPILVAGDSDGDFYMMDAFKDSALLLVLDKNQNETTKIYKFREQGINSRGDLNTGIIVQSRDYSTGLFFKSERTR